MREQERGRPLPDGLGTAGPDRGGHERRDTGHGHGGDAHNGARRDHDGHNGHNGHDSHAPDQQHGTSHAHGAHTHGVGPDADRRWLLIGLTLIVGFMSVEVVVGVLAHSLALLSDAAHMLTDAASIGLALFAMRLAARPAKGGYTFGLKRAEILSAQANGVTLLVLSVVLASRPSAGWSARRRSPAGWCSSPRWSAWW